VTTTTTPAVMAAGARAVTVAGPQGAVPEAGMAAAAQATARVRGTASPDRQHGAVDWMTAASSPRAKRTWRATRLRTYEGPG